MWYNMGMRWNNLFIFLILILVNFEMKVMFGMLISFLLGFSGGGNCMCVCKVD